MATTTIASNQYHAQVAGLTDGGFAIVWHSSGGVYGQNFNAAGQKIGSEFRIDTPGVGGSEPFVTALPGGGVVVSWTASNVIHTRTFGVTNVNVSPFNLIDANAAANVVIEEAAVGALVGITARASDADVGDTLTYSLTNDAGGRFKIDATTGVISVANGALVDFETATNHTVTVKATDSSGLFVTRDFVIQIADGNDAPTSISLSAASVVENAAGAVIGTLSVVDPNVGDSHSLTVSDNRFEIVAGQLKLKAGISLDYETASSINVTVTATDNGGLSKAQVFAISVDNVNEAPTAINLSKLTILEAAQGAEVGALSVVDPDTGDSHSFAVSDNRFEVVNGKLKLKAGISIDFATEPNVTLSVIATDAGGLSKSETFNLTVMALSNFVTIAGFQNPIAVTGATGGDGSQMTTLSDGRQLVTWVSGGVLKGRYYNALGQALSAELSLDVVSTGKVSVTALAGGGFVASRIMSGGNAVNVQRYDALGVAVGAAWAQSVSLGAVLDASQLRAPVTALSDGGYVVVWDSTGIDVNNQGIAGQRFDSAGNTVGPVFRINTASSSNQVAPDIVALPNGGFVVVWTSSANGQDISGQIYNAQGLQVGGGEFTVNTYTNSAQYGVQIAILSDGGFVVAWQSYVQDGDGSGIFGQRFDQFGAKVGAEFRANTTTANDQRHVDLVGLSDGGYVLVWTGSSGGTFGQVYDATGAKVGTEFQANIAATGSYTRPSVAALPNGGFTISWTDGTGAILTRNYRDAFTLAGDDTANVLTGTSSNETLIGAGGNDTLNGDAGNDLLVGGAGNDTLIGGEGADRYQIGRATGQDLVQSLDTDGGADALVIGTSVASDQLWFARDGNDLVVSIIGTNDRATIESWYGSGNHQLDQVQLANGKYATAADVEQLVTAMASFSPPPVGQLNLDTTTRQGLAPTLAAAWH